MRPGFFLILVGILLTTVTASSQKFYTKSGKISFYSSTSMENIEAINKSVTVLLDAKTGSVQFAVLMKGFEFKKALMQEHFNKDYLESDKYPKAEFKGQIVDNSAVNYSADGNYTATVKGQLTIHGVSKEMETSGTVTIKDGKPSLYSVFNVLVADYQINIPKIYRNNISKSIKVTVTCSLAAL